MASTHTLGGFVNIAGNVVTVDPAKVYPRYIEALGGTADQYWVTIAKLSMREDVKALFRKETGHDPAVIRILRDDAWALANLPTGAGEQQALKDWRRIYARLPKGKIVSIGQAHNAN